MLFRLGLFALSTGMLFAADPFAILTASGDIKLNGRPLPTVGAPNWPLEVGDELITGAAKAVLTFPDGMRIALAPASKVVLQQCGHSVVQFFQGALDYDKPADSKAELCALGRPVKPAPGSHGSVTIELPDKVLVRVASEQKVLTSGKCPCSLGAPWGIGGMSAGAKAAIVMGAAGATATAATVGVITATRPNSTDSMP